MSTNTNIYNCSTADFLLEIEIEVLVQKRRGNFIASVRFEQAAIRMKKMVAALVAAESFVAGFEDDDTQEGIGELLKSTREAIA